MLLKVRAAWGDRYVDLTSGVRDRSLKAAVTIARRVEELAKKEEHR